MRVQRVRRCENAEVVRKSGGKREERLQVQKEE